MLLRSLAVLGGAGAYALALPPFDHPLCGWIALVPLLLAVRGRSPLAALGWGAAAGFVSGWSVTWWLAGAASSYFASGLLAGALATSAAYVAALCTTFGAFAAGSAWLLRHDRRLGSRLAIAALWTLLELLRSRLLGQPWALLGYTQHGVIPLVQLAAVTGVAGLSFLVAFGNAGIAEAAARTWRRASPRRVAAPLVAPALAVALTLVGGLLVLPVGEEQPPPGALRVGLVQSNLPPAFRWTRAHAEEQLFENLRLSATAVRAGAPSLLVWPENSIGAFLEQEPTIAAMLGRVTRASGVDLLLGGPRWADGHTYNSARLVDRRGRVAGHYDKRRLVAFAEAPPFEQAGDDAPSDRPSVFTPGTSPAVLTAGVPLAVSICQEALYPDTIAAAVREGGSVLVNIANDGWLDGGHGVGSRQHAAMTALRAVETRRWLVRAATTGVSMVVDPWGRTVSALPSGEPGVLNAAVVPRHDLTPYVRFGDWIGPACAVLLLVVVLRRRRAVARWAPVPLPVAG